MRRSSERNSTSGACGILRCVVPVPTGTLMCCEFGLVYRNNKQKEVLITWDSLDYLLCKTLDRPNLTKK